MVTPKSYFDAAGVHWTAELYFGLSTDTKPVTVANGSAFIELDTSNLYFFNAEGSSGEEWVEWAPAAELTPAEEDANAGD